MLLMLKPSARILVAISLGAIAGALSRYFLAGWLSQLVDHSSFWGTWPLGTWLVNLSGCFGMGVVTTLFLLMLTVHSEVRLAITTGFLGSYTTFSSYALETVKLFQSDAWGLGILYWSSSILLGLTSFYLGIGCMEWIWSRRISQ